MFKLLQYLGLILTVVCTVTVVPTAIAAWVIEGWEVAVVTFVVMIMPLLVATTFIPIKKT